MIRKEIKSLILRADGYSDIECCAPSTLCSALIKNGYIDSDVEISDGVIKPVELPSSCSFVASIEFSEAERAKRHVYLRLRGIMAKGEIVFNGKSCGIVGNVNSVFDLDIRDKIRAGENILEIRCAESLGRRSNICSDGNISDSYVTAPKLADIGILEIPEIVFSDYPIVSGVRTEQRFENGKVNVFVNTKTLGAADDLRVVASLVSPSGKIHFGGACEGGAMISVSEPELWWPNGYGAQMLYKLSVTLYHGSDPVDTYERKIGLRKPELIREENGTPWLFVNGVKVFPRGAAYLAQKSILSEISRGDIERLIKCAAEMNFNTLSVFDEGVCPSEAFFEFCDKYGIMVWQSLSVPYTAPPAAGVFASGLYDAIDDTVARISEHASVVRAFLAITEANHGMMRLFPDAVEEFRSVCLKIITPIIDKITNFLFEQDIEQLLAFDERYVPVLKNGSSYTCAVPSVKTLSKFLSDDECNLFSKTAEAHIPSREACLAMLDRAFCEMRFPSGMAELAYTTQATAAYAASESIRRARCENSACSSAVFRQFNDGANLITPSMIDFDFRKKHVCHKVKEAFGQTVVSVSKDEKEIKVYIRNDLKKDYEGKLLIALYDTKNKCWFENTRSISVPSASSVLVAEEDLSKYLDVPESYYLIYELFTEKMVTDSGTVRFVPLKHFCFRDPLIKAEITGMGKSFTAKLTASSYVAGAEISFDGIEAEFDKNLTDILPDAPTVIDFRVDSALAPEELQSRIVIRTPAGCGK